MPKSEEWLTCGVIDLAGLEERVVQEVFIVHLPILSLDIQNELLSERLWSAASWRCARLGVSAEVEALLETLFEQCHLVITHHPSLG